MMFHLENRCFKTSKANTCSNSAIGTLKQGVQISSKLTSKIPEHVIFQNFCY